MAICDHYRNKIIERRIEALELAMMEMHADYFPPCRTLYSRDAVVALKHDANKELEGDYVSFQECSLALRLFDADEENALNYIVDMHTS